MPHLQLLKKRIPVKTTLCFVFRGEDLLMIEKKRGMGAGKWNVPGGKCLETETLEEAAIRETREETGLTPSQLVRVGRLEFYFPEESLSFDNICEVFTATAFTGDLIEECEECRSFWLPQSQIPFEKMWPDDRIWVPLIFQKKNFHRRYEFDDKNRLLRESVLEEVREKVLKKVLEKTDAPLDPIL